MLPTLDNEARRTLRAAKSDLATSKGEEESMGWGWGASRGHGLQAQRCQWRGLYSIQWGTEMCKQEARKQNSKCYEMEGTKCYGSSRRAPNLASENSGGLPRGDDGEAPKDEQKLKVSVSSFSELTLRKEGALCENPWRQKRTVLTGKKAKKPKTNKQKNLHNWSVTDERAGAER
jgi:hypothetical protein